MFRKISIIMVSLIVLFVVGCSASKAVTAPEKMQPLKIGVLPIEDNLPFYVAEADKMFEKAGLQVTLVPFSSAQERDAALQAGQIDGEVADLVAVALLKKGGTDVKVASIGLGANPKEGRFALLSAPSSKIRTAADLKNVPIAISDNSIIEFVTDQMAQEKGLKSAEIKKVSVPKIPIRMQMLASGQIQAAVLPDPLASLAEKQGAHVVLDDTKGTKNFTQTVILFRQESITNNKAAVRKLVAVYGEAGKALTDNLAQYKSLLIDKAKVPAPIKDSYKYPTFSKPQLPKEEDFNRVMNWMKEKKLLDQPYKYKDLVDSTLL